MKEPDLSILHKKDRTELLWRSPSPRTGKKKVLFLCVHNSARSQMAEGYLNHLYGDRYQAFSAGGHPTRVNPVVIDIMAEEGIDLSQARAKSVEEMFDHYFDLVVTMCSEAEEACPVYPGVDELEHHPLPDPTDFDRPPEERMKRWRELRDSIMVWITERFGGGG